MKLLNISDIHANWPALLAVFAAETEIREILCIGDSVGYGRQPLRCVEWAINHIPVRNLIQDNHDWAVAWDNRITLDNIKAFSAGVPINLNQSITAPQVVPLRQALTEFDQPQKLSA